MVSFKHANVSGSESILAFTNTSPAERESEYKHPVSLSVTENNIVASCAEVIEIAVSLIAVNDAVP